MSCLNEVGDEALEVQVLKGWVSPDKNEWENRDPYVIPTKLALIHSEVSEALEEFRKEHRLNFFGMELADVLIRTLGLARGLGLDVDHLVNLKMAINRGREHRHGGRLV